ncbi:hypothetical protein Tco_1152317, partial [Tanacetum coccineum]
MFSHLIPKRLSRSDEVLKLKNFKKDATLKLFKSTNQERYEHVGPEVTSSQDGKVHKMAKRDYAWLMISRPWTHPGWLAPSGYNFVAWPMALELIPCGLRLRGIVSSLGR